MGPNIPRRLRGAGLWVIDDHILMESLLGAHRWGVVGGGVEPGESADQACEREFREELGVQVRCERLAMVGDFFIRPHGRVEQDVCFYFVVTAAREASGLPTVTSQEPGLEFAWVPLTALGEVSLVPPSLDVLVPRAVSGGATLYVTYDCRTAPDERRGVHIRP